MNITFENKVALVTGAASGLGLATAIAFAESGAAVVLADWNEKGVQTAASAIAAKGHKTLAVTCDVSDDAQVENMVRQTVATFGRLDAAYNNAGVQNVLAETADSPRDDYDRVMAINLRGVWSSMKFELQQMRAQGSGAIVNCSSLGGLIGGNRRGTYHAAKHGVIGLTKSADSRIRNARHSRQRRLPRHDPDAHVRQDDSRRTGTGAGQDAQHLRPHEATGAPRGDCRRGLVALQRRGQLHHRPVDFGRRWLRDALEN